MAVVLVIMGLVMLTVFPALSMMRTASQTQATQAHLDALMTATAAFVQANGCLPCPTPAGALGTAFGLVGNDGSVASPSACGACNKNPEGIPPFAALGVSPATAHDGYGHWITMRIDPALANPPHISVPPYALCTANDIVSNICTSAQQNISAKGLCTANLSTQSGASPVKVTIPHGNTANKAVIFVSHGARGFGSFINTGVADFSTGTRMNADHMTPCNPASNSGYAKCNADGDTTFYDAPVSMSNTDPYDDVLAYVDRNALISRFGNGSCQTQW
jgi:type II secretory pathway pseudopilin PulG